ncbi:condensation domain-containing protein, partial [Kutzneria sp. 744]|uniref:condensation domain-containing protein n=1 Tax=Kutzneria sp. (strain 744) TaxID=345341 RepID=UPI0005BDB089
AQALDAWARKRGVTPFVGIAVAYLRALHECTGHEQVVIGTPHHGRHDPGFAGTVGYFVNLLPLLGDFRDRPDRDGLADRVWRELRDALRCADVPLSRLIRALGPASRGDRTPLFQATLTFQQSADDLPLAEGFAAPWSGVGQVMGGVEVEAFDLPPRDAAFALALYGARDRDRLAFRLVWQRDVVDEPLAHRLRDAIRRGVLRFDSEG